MSTQEGDSLGQSKRAKRAARACNHCRWKRLKCSDEKRDQACMNCLIYGTKCEYSASWNLQANTKKRKRASSDASPTNESPTKTSKLSVRKESQDLSTNDVPFRRSAVESEEDKVDGEPPPTDDLGPDSLFSDIVENVSCVGSDLEEMLIRYALDKRFSMDPTPKPSSIFGGDDIALRLSGLMIPLLNGSEEATLPSISSDGSGLPSRSITNALLNVYFTDFSPIWPFLDETEIRIQFEQYYQAKEPIDELWMLLAKLILCNGAAASRDNIDGIPNLKALRESLFSVVPTSIHLACASPKLNGLQVLLLTALYYFQMDMPSSAWFWCGSAIHTSKSFGLRDDDLQLCGTLSCTLRDMALRCAFVLESHLSILQFRLGEPIPEALLTPKEDFDARKHFLFFLRLKLADLIHRFCAMFSQNSLVPIQLSERIDEFFKEVIAWKQTIPFALQPGAELICKPEEYHHILLIHVQHHNLMLAFQMTLGGLNRFLPAYFNLQADPSSTMSNLAAKCESHARSLLQTIHMIFETNNIHPRVDSWIKPYQILPAFGMIYFHLMKHHFFASSRSNLHHLFNASSDFKTKVKGSSGMGRISMLLMFMTNCCSGRLSHATLPLPISITEDGSNGSPHSVPSVGSATYDEFSMSPLTISSIPTSGDIVSPNCRQPLQPSSFSPVSVEPSITGIGTPLMAVQHPNDVVKAEVNLEVDFFSNMHFNLGAQKHQSAPLGLNVDLNVVHGQWGGYLWQMENSSSIL